jgi:hypothetical protein
MYVEIYWIYVQGSLISPWGGIEPLDSPPLHLARKQRERGNNLVYL